ncbi:hypothetical protein ACLKA6_005599 [Drosophila palustris]
MNNKKQQLQAHQSGSLGERQRKRQRGKERDQQMVDKDKNETLDVDEDADERMSWQISAASKFVCCQLVA